MGIRMKVVAAAAVVCSGALVLAPVAAAASLPGAPRNAVAQPKDASAIVSWEAPSSDGGAAITAYRVESTPGGVVKTVTGSELTTTVTGLTNGTSYTFVVKATNAEGTGPASSPTAPVTPGTPPTAPRSVTATAGNAQVTVSWLAPSSNGGSPITGYRVTRTPGGTTTTVGGAATSATVTGLTNGTSYTFTVVAFNAIGDSPASAPTTPVTPSGVPGAPTGVTATPGNGQATVIWVAPASDGGSPITSYTVTAAPGGATASGGGSVRTVTVPGLTNGTSYTFTVKATNARGTGPASTPSAAVTPGVPGAPTGVTATPGNAQVTVGWVAPSSNGGSSITGYTVTATPGGRIASVGGSARSATVTGLTNGTSYTFTVRATNARGTGPASTPSAAVTPGVPGAPTGVKAVPGNAQATVTWVAPSSNGGSSITGYTVTATPGGATVSVGASARSTTVVGLTNGTSYTFIVRASNARGAGPASTPSAAVTPFVREVRRLAGASRVLTAIRVSEDRWATASVGESSSRTLAQAVVLARSDDFADALAGTPLAVRKVGPLLLTAPGSLDAGVRNEIVRILPRGSTVHLLGGTSALSSATETVLQSDGYQVVRYAGSDRFATAVRVAESGMGNPATQLIVTGTDFADALSAGAAAGRVGGAILLTDGSALPAATAQYLRDHGGSRIAIGGQATRAYPSAEAIAGVDRYDTAVRVARRFFSSPTEVGIASGRAFPDALAGGAHVASRGGPLLLVGDQLPAVVERYLAERRTGSMVVHLYGGTAAVSGQVKVDIEDAIT